MSEFVETNMSEEIPEQEAKKARVTKTFEIEVEGVMQTMSQAAYARHLFKQDKSRKEIAAALECPYYIVYSATANMFNAAHPEGGAAVGGTHRGEIITITSVTRDYVESADEYTGDEELVGVSRPDYMRECVKGGMSRGEVAKMLDCPYSTVYAATKDSVEKSEGRSGRAMVIDPADGIEKPRVEVIRAMFAAGSDREGIRREIATALGCDYAVVWAATKAPKTPEDVEEVEVEGVEEGFEDDGFEETEDEDAE